MKNALFTLATLITGTLGAFAEEAPKDEALILGTLLEATQNNDLKKFESVCDEAMTTAMTEEKLAQVSGQMSPVMKDGFKREYMGVLDRGTVKTYYWKIDFQKEGVPDMLAELSMKNGKTAGFFIR
jgi:hypothetical protein